MLEENLKPDCRRDRRRRRGNAAAMRDSLFGISAAAAGAPRGSHRGRGGGDYQELEAAGIAAPVVDADMLRACIESMLSRDADLRSVMGQECVHRVQEAERRVTVSLAD